jgi:hypothetical protein
MNKDKKDIQKNIFMDKCLHLSVQIALFKNFYSSFHCWR